MGKMKTKKALAKRVKVTGTGKWKRHSSKTSHLFANKSTKSKRQARKSSNVSKSDVKRLKNLI
jgi:large subunit ribosomal protein L35